MVVVLALRRGVYMVRVSNPAGSVGSAAVLVLVGHAPPTVTVTLTPPDYAIGTLLTYSGAAVQEGGGTITPQAAAFRWTLSRRHDSVDVVMANVTGVDSGLIVVPPGGDASPSLLVCASLKVGSGLPV